MEILLACLSALSYDSHVKENAVWLNGRVCMSSISAMLLG